MDNQVLIFAYFKGHGDGLHIAFSADGYDWTPLHADQPLVTPKIGTECIMRDPCVIQGADNLFHLVWTVGWNERGIGYASSPDLKHWSEQRYLPVMEHEGRARNCWAPEIFYYEAEKTYLIYWSSTVEGMFPETQLFGDDGYNHRIYYVTTKDFIVFSETRLLYDPGFNCIDANIVHDGETFLMFLKNETLAPPQKNLRMARGKNPFTFGTAGEAITPNYYWAEGPTALKLDDEWLVFFDKYKIKEIGAIRSVDLVNWEDVSHLIKFPHGAQHGYVFRASNSILKNFNVHQSIEVKEPGGM